MTFPVDQNEYLSQLSLFPTPYSEVDKTVLRNGLKFFVKECFNIPYPIVYQYFHYYKLLYWSGHHVIESIEAGMIARDNYAFIVQYAKGLTRGKILANKDAQYKLSFRIVKAEWCHDPVVIISEV